MSSEHHEGVCAQAKPLEPGQLQLDEIEVAEQGLEAPGECGREADPGGADAAVGGKEVAPLGAGLSDDRVQADIVGRSQLVPEANEGVRLVRRELELFFARGDSIDLEEEEETVVIIEWAT